VPRLKLRNYASCDRWLRRAIAGETVDQNRVVLTLVPDRGQWKLVHATVI